MSAIRELIRRFKADGHHAAFDAFQFARESVARAIVSAMQRPRFGALGRGSVVWKPRMLTNPRFMQIGSNVTIRSNARLEAIRHYKGATFSPELRIGDGTFIEHDAHIACAQSVSIGEDVLMASGVFISDHNHSLDAQKLHPLEGALVAKPVAIGDGCWLGERCVILPGVTLGARTIVGAGAVVTKSFPANSTVAGIPAKEIRKPAP